MSDLLTKVCNAVDDAFETEHVPWFKHLVETPSYTKTREDVEAAAKIIDALAEQIGLRRTLFPDPDGVFADQRLD